MANVVQASQGWALGSPIGQGGFGRVFEAVGNDGRVAALKLIPKQPGADRELLFENLTGVRHVVPIIDSGESDGNWVVVMPRAAKSLRGYLAERPPMTAEETVAILADVCTALADLHGKVVHRDIKPENVLLLDGHWCLSDFGIARYAEASTAADTHKWEGTAAYTAPERWRGERATAASDIYSLGVMAYEMLSGHCPFAGPDFRAQHLNNEAPPLTGSPALVSALISECLFKSPEVRPTAANALARLSVILRPPSPGAGQLQAANREQVERLASQAAAYSAARSAAERRREIIASATKLLGMVAERLAQAIRDNAPNASWRNTSPRSPLGWSVTLSQAVLTFGSVEEASHGWPPGWKPGFEVVAQADISVRIPPDRFGYEGRSHSLWFCDAQQKGVFRWYETAFMVSPLIPKRGRQNPFSLPAGEQAGKALAPGMAEFQVAWPFTPIEPGNDTEFLERWMSWLAGAAQGQLGHPSSMPERRPEGTWRRS